MDTYLGKLYIRKDRWEHPVNAVENLFAKAD